MNSPAPGTAGHYANFLFRRRVLSTGQVRGSQNYSASVDGLPGWIAEQSLPLGEVVGVYENVPGSPRDALVFCDEQLLLLNRAGKAGVEVVRLGEVENWEWFSKEPPATALVVVMNDARRIELPCYGTEGVVASLASFIGRASRLLRDAGS